MRISIPRGGLKDAVGGFNKIINGKTTLPVLGCIRFENNGHGTIAQATDLDQTASYRFAEAKADGEGAFIVPLQAIKDLAKGAAGDAVEFETTDNLNVTVTNHVGSHAVRHPVTGMELDEWPTCPPQVETQPAEGFLETYRRLIPFASTDTTRYLLNGVYVEVGDKGDTPVSMVATDGRRLCVWNSMSLPVSKSVIVPTTKFLAWTGIGSEARIGLRTEKEKKEVCVKALAVNAGPWAYDVRVLDGTYPNFRQVIPGEPGDHVIMFADVDVEVLKKVLPTFPGGDEITIVGQDGGVTLYGRGVDDEQWSNLKLEATRYVGERTFIGLNRHYLLDALVAGFRQFCITDELCPVLSRDDRGGTFVLMPMRVEDPEDKAETAANAEEAEVKPVAAEVVENHAPEVQPAAANTDDEPTRRTRKMTKEGNGNSTTEQGSALDKALAAVDTAKTKLRETASALAELSDAVKTAVKEGKAQETDLRKARETLGKLQSITL